MESIGDDPYSAARCVSARPVPSIASHFGVNAHVCPPFKSKEKAHADNCGFMACSPTCGHSQHCDYSRITGTQEVINSPVGFVPGNVSALSEARFHKSVKSGRGALGAFDRAV